MRHVQGDDRSQRTLLPDCLDDYVDSEHPARVIDAYIDSLDMEALGFRHAVTRDTGRKPYHPVELLRLYVYGYLKKVATSRRLELECCRNLEVIWSMKRLQPDFKTIADFRKDNGVAIRSACRAFTLFCREAQLLNGQLVAIDGSKFKAAASKDQMLTRKQLKRDRKKLEQRIQRYLEQLDQGDGEDTHLELERGQVQAALEQLEEKVQWLDHREEAMDSLGGDQHCATETDARLVLSGRDGMIVGYNLKSAVHAETGLIIHHAVCNEAGDSRQLQPMAEAAKTALEVDTLEVLADAGYSNSEQQAVCEEQGITSTVPRRQKTNAYPGLFQKNDFTYDATSDSYRCPAGEVLRYSRDDKRRNLHVYTRSGCSECSLKMHCTKAKDARSVTRSFYEATLERSDERLRSDPDLMKRRMGIAERPFAMLKQSMSWRRYVCRGLNGARAETAIGVLGFHIQRMTNQLGVPRMLELIG